MNLTLDKQLCKKYPVIFQHRHGDMKETCMCWGMSCGDGWYNLLDRLCEELTTVSKDSGLIIIADQVKEKFAGLRFYYHTKLADNIVAKENKLIKIIRSIGCKSKFVWKYYCRSKLINNQWKYYKKIDGTLKRYDITPYYKKIDNLISKAEDESYDTCESCGGSGKTINKYGWLYAMCTPCFKKFEEKGFGVKSKNSM